MTVKRTNKAMAKDAACIAGETIVPGVSLMVDGQMKSGLLHTGAALVAKVALGPIGLLAVAANSYSKSKTGESLLQKFTSEKGPGDFSVRQEVSSAVENGATIDEISEAINEDVEDIYHELTLNKEAPQADTETEASAQAEGEADKAV